MIGIKYHPGVQKNTHCGIYCDKNEKDVIHCCGLGANSYVDKPAIFEALLFMAEQIYTYWPGMASVA